jgi:predicted Ser/Thr protein kinase
MIGSCIGPYKILRELAADRVGRVFEAVDITRKKNVLIKCLRPEIASQPEVVARLYSKAETLALLNHEYIARLFGFIRRADGLYLVMESVEGKNLHEFLQEKGRLDLVLALAFFRQILLAVEFAHRLGVTHGELNPTNIVLTDFARIKVLDFAIATVLGSPNPGDTTIHAAAYMSPEQLRGDRADVRSDIYSLGILLYKLIVGKTPFKSDTPEGIAQEHAQSTPLPASLLVPGIPHWLDLFLLRAIAPSPANRFQSILAMSNAIGLALEAEVRKDSPKGRVFSPPRRAEPALSARRINPGMAGFAAQLHAFVDGARQKSGIICSRAWKSLDAVHPKQLGARLEGKIQRTSAAVKPILVKALVMLTGPISLGLKRTRETGTAAANCVRDGAAAVNPAPLMHDLTGELRASIRSYAGKLQASRQNLLARSKEFVSSVSENGWKRYTVIAVLLASVMIETFIFGGANTLLKPGLLKPELNPLTPETANLVTDDAPRIEPRATAARTSDTKTFEPKPEPSVVKHVNPRPKTSGKPGSPADQQYLQALNIKRTVTYRVAPLEKQISRPSAQEIRRGELSRSSPDSNLVKNQLNVKWEN